MKHLLFLFCLLPFASYSQGPFWYKEYQVSAINENQISWDSLNSDNLIWQFGYNQKPFFGDPHNKILVTGLTNMYDSLVDTSVDIILTRPYSGDYVEEGTSYILKFDHKIDTDSMEAGGFFEVNIDNDSLSYIKNGDTLKTFWLKFFLQPGDTVNDAGGAIMGQWYEMICDNGDTILMPDNYSWHNFYHNINGYHDSLFDQNMGFTGTYSEWKSCYIELFFYEGGIKIADQEDTLTFRFHFKSDSTSNGKNGWAIKNIESGYAVHYMGSLAENSENGINVFPNPASDYIYFYPTQESTLNYSNVSIYNVNGELIESSKFVAYQRFDISDYSPGIYFYSITEDDSEIIQTGKFVKF